MSGFGFLLLTYSLRWLSVGICKLGTALHLTASTTSFMMFVLQVVIFDSFTGMAVYVIPPRVNLYVYLASPSMSFLAGRFTLKLWLMAARQALTLAC
jgi:hypothetical protein